MRYYRDSRFGFAEPRVKYGRHLLIRQIAPDRRGFELADSLKCVVHHIRINGLAKRERQSECWRVGTVFYRQFSDFSYKCGQLEYGKEGHLHFMGIHFFIELVASVLKPVFIGCLLFGERAMVQLTVALLVSSTFNLAVADSISGIEESMLVMWPLLLVKLHVYCSLTEYVNEITCFKFSKFNYHKIWLPFAAFNISTLLFLIKLTYIVISVGFSISPVEKL